MLRPVLIALPLLGASPAVARQCDTPFELENRSGETIEEFYFSPSSQRGRGVDPVADDFRIIWRNGDTVELRDINICRVSRIVATRNGARAE